jgi:arylsulfatase
MFTGKHVLEHGVTRDGEGIEEGETIFDELRKKGYETALLSSNPYLTSLDTGLASGFDTVEGAVRDPPFDGVDPDEYKGEVGRFIKDAVKSGRPFRSLGNGVISKLAWDYPQLVPPRLERKVASGTVQGATYTDLLADWVRETSGPWAACINYMDAHHPYVPNAEHNRWDDGSIARVQDSIGSIPLGFYTGMDRWWKCELLEYLYDGTVRQIDHEIGRLVEFLEQRDIFEDTLVIITSDHGEGFGERSAVREVGIAGHNIGEHEVNLHVPLVVKGPMQTESRERESIVTLSFIPDIIRQAINGECGPYDIPDDPIVARTSGLRDIQQNRLREADIDLSPFQEASDVFYRRVDGVVTKYVAWKEERSVVKCIDAQTEYDVDKKHAIGIEQVFDSFDDVSIKRDRHPKEVDKETEQRLEDLGYR